MTREIQEIARLGDGLLYASDIGGVGTEASPLATQEYAGDLVDAVADYLYDVIPIMAPLRAFQVGNVSTGVKAIFTVAYDYLGIFEKELVIVATVGTAPASQPILIDVHLNGTTMFAAPGDRLAIDAASTSGTAIIPAATIPLGSRITIEVDQVGSGTVGADLAVTLSPSV